MAFVKACFNDAFDDNGLVVFGLVVVFVNGLIGFKGGLFDFKGDWSSDVLAIDSVNGLIVQIMVK